MFNFRYAVFCFLLTVSSLVHAQELVVDTTPNMERYSSFDINDILNAKVDDIGREYYVGATTVSYLDKKVIRLEQYAVKLHNRRMVQALSHSVIVYVPAYQTYAVHRVVLWRDGREINVTEKVRATFSYQETEAGVDDHEGMAAVNIFIPNAKSGDILEISYSVTGQNTAFGDNSVGMLINMPLIWNSMDVFRTIILPEDNQIYFDYKNDMKEGLKERIDGSVKYSWHRKRRPDDESDNKLKNLDQVNYSTYGKWEELSNWARGILNTNEGSTKKISKLAKKLTRGKKTEKEKVRALYGYMKKNINYVGMEIGRHGYVPFSPNEVLDNGYGDCKDQAMMLIAMLKSVGIDSWPALVHNQEGHSLEDDFVSPILFNHLIVSLEMDGKPYWLDPTLFQYEFTPVWLDAPDYGKALIVRSGEVALTDIKMDDVVNSASYTYEFDFTEGIDFEGSYKSNSIMRGANAESFRSKRDELGDDELREELTSRVQNMNEGSEALSPQIFVESAKENSLTLQEEYKFSNLGINKDDSSYSFYDFVPTSINYALMNWEFQEGAGDKKLLYPFKTNERAIFKLGKPVDVDEFDIKVESSYHRFIHKGSYQDNLYVLEYSYETFKRLIPEEDQEKYLKDVVEIEEYLSTRIYQFDEDPEIIVAERGRAYSKLYAGTARKKVFNTKLQEFMDENNITSSSDMISVYREILEWDNVPKDSKIFANWMIAKAFFYEREYEKSMERLRYVDENAIIGSSEFLLIQAKVYRELNMLSELKGNLIESIKSVEEGNSYGRRTGLFGALLIVYLHEEDYREAALAAVNYIKLLKRLNTLSFKREFRLKNMPREAIDEFLKVGINLSELVDYDINTPFYYPAPDYPEKAKEERVEGIVDVAIDISSSAKVTACNVVNVENTNEILAEASCAAAKKNQFIQAYNPTSEKGVKIRYTFSIENGVSVEYLNMPEAHEKDETIFIPLGN